MFSGMAKRWAYGGGRISAEVRAEGIRSFFFFSFSSGLAVRVASSVCAGE